MPPSSRILRGYPVAGVAPLRWHRLQATIRQIEQRIIRYEREGLVAKMRGRRNQEHLLGKAAGMEEALQLLAAMVEDHPLVDPLDACEHEDREEDTR